MTMLWIEGATDLATPLGDTPRAGAAQGRLERHSNVDLLCRDGEIVAIGPAAEIAAAVEAAGDEGIERFDARGRTLIPGFVDPHTHLPWAGSREGEFAQRLAGRSYQEIAAEGGGILSTVRTTREADEDEIARLTRARLDRMLAWGTTTVEAKSGYGLSVEAELKQLRSLDKAAEDHPLDVVPTLLAAHETPPELRPDTDRYVDIVCSEIVPAVAEAELATYCDVFCEEGVFSPEQSRRVLEAGLAHGLVPRLHADEFVDSHGAELAAEVGAVTADHLMAVSTRGLESLRDGGVLAGLLPGTSFFLKKKVYAPARRLIEEGVAVTLATDCNPGSSHTESMPMIFWLAVLELDMTVEEALTAATLNAACSVGMGERIGSLEIGKQADVVILEGSSFDSLAYHYGIHPIHAVVKRGRVVFEASDPA